MPLAIHSLARFLSSSLTLAGVGLALGIVVSSSAAAEGHDCPELTRTKYPFLSCKPNAYGGVTLGMTGYEAPAACELRLPDGQCAASPEPWTRPPALPARFGS